MNTVEQIRRGKLAALIREAGSQASLSEKIDKAPAQISQWLNASANSKTGKPRVMSHAIARELEQKMGKPNGWMDTPEPAVGGLGEDRKPGLTPAPHQAPSTVAGEPPDLIITEYSTGGSMGNGFNLADNPPGLIKSWRVTPDWLRLNVPSHTSLKNLAIVTGFGPSMKPMFNPGDPLLVDTGVKVIDHEGVYFFRVGDEGFIKLVQRVPNPEGAGVMLQIISKNPDYPPYPMSPKNPHFEVLGKVLTVWRSEQF